MYIVVTVEKRFLAEMSRGGKGWSQSN